MTICFSRADIEAALSDGAEIQVEGTVLTGAAPLTVPFDRVRFCGRGVIGAVGDALVFTGNQCFVDDLEIQSGARGAVFSGLNHKVRGARITSGAQGVYAQHGGGLELLGVHLNGHSNGSRAIEVGDWDTLDMTDVLTEQHSTGFRVGILGDVGNVQMSNVRFDRAYSVGVHVETTGGVKAHQIQMSNIWVSFADYPFIADGTGVSRFQVPSIMTVDCTHKLCVVQNGAGVLIGMQSHY